MKCCIEDIYRKDVINIENGSCIGYINDVEVDTCTGQILRLFVADYDKLIRIKKQEYTVICWENIAVIGDDSILVKNVQSRCNKNTTQKGFFNLFSK